MAVATVKFEGWKTVEAMLSKKDFEKILHKHVRRATALNAKAGQAAIRRQLTGGVQVGTKANAPLTRAIKKSSKPLIDHGDLFQAVTESVESWDKAFVGILKTNNKYNIALFLHEGGTILVTPKMRSLFQVLAAASAAHAAGRKLPTLSPRAASLFARFKGWKALKPDTAAIIVPGRPFIKQALESLVYIAGCEKRWQAAVDAAISELAGS